MAQKWVTIAQAAQETGYLARYLRQLIWEGELKTLHLSDENRANFPDVPKNVDFLVDLSAVKRWQKRTRRGPIARRTKESA